MFCFAGVARFTDLRNDYAAMIPDPLPDGMWVIYLTGLLEIAGGLGLLLPDWRRRAGICLVLFLIAIFPANVNAALRDIRVWWSTANASAFSHDDAARAVGV